jgi:transcriptional regulator with XRE-family HTH domain
MHATTDIDKRFIANLKVARKALGMRQVDIADRMRRAGFELFSQSTVFATERGFRPVRLAEADELSRIVGVPLDRMTTESQSRIRAIVRDSLMNGATR